LDPNRVVDYYSIFL